MVFYVFPRTFISYDKVSVRFSNQDPILYSPSFYSYLQELKQNTKDISFFHHNPYIWLYTNKNQSCIANIQASSAGVYEFIEIVDLLRLSWDSNAINTCHMGENAQAMIQAIQYIRKKKGQGFRVINDTHEIQELDCQKKFHLITADCTNAEDSEYDSCIATIDSICYSLCRQNRNGIYIIKLGDTFSELSLDIIYFLSHFYEKTYFIKPSVNDIASGEKFMVCKGFLLEELDETCLTMIENLNYCTRMDLKLDRIFQDPIPLYFIGKIEEINSIFGQPRLEQMSYVLSTVEHSKQHSFTSKQDIQKCIEWCSKYRVPVHDIWMPWK